MKTRKIIITMEVETDAPLKGIRALHNYYSWVRHYDGILYRNKVLRVQANVIKEGKK